MPGPVAARHVPQFGRGVFSFAGSVAPALLAGSALIELPESSKYSLVRDNSGDAVMKTSREMDPLHLHADVLLRRR